MASVGYPQLVLLISQEIPFHKVWHVGKIGHFLPKKVIFLISGIKEHMTYLLTSA